MKIALWWSGLVLLCVHSSAFGFFVQHSNISPTDIAVTSGTFNPAAPSTLNAAINQSGLAVADFATDDLSAVLHDPANANEARLFSSSSASVRLDLGADQAVVAAYLWNSDSLAGNNVGTYEYTFRDAAENFLAASGLLSATDVALSELGTPDVFLLPGALYSVRYVDLEVDRRLTSANGIFGFGEVAFGVIPEPSTVLLLAVGTTVLVAGRKRRLQMHREYRSHPSD